MKNSKVFILADQEDASSQEALLRDYWKMEEMLLRCCRREGSAPEPLDSSFYDLYGICWKVPSTGARVGSDNATAILNRYCGRLPGDKFTRLSPKITYVEENGSPGNFVATMQLPLNSALKKEIMTRVALPKKAAQIAVTIEAIKELHNCKELNDYLLPAGREVLKYDFDFHNDADANLAAAAAPGTHKRRQRYAKRIPSAWQDCQPMADRDLFVTVIDISTSATASSALHDFSNLSDNRRSFNLIGFISSNAMPKIPDFPLFTGTGELTVRVSCNSKPMRLSQQEIAKLWIFHKFLFDDILRVPSFNKEFSSAGSLCSFITVPLKRGDEDPLLCAIDWAFVERTLCVAVDYESFPNVPSEEERKHNFQFDPFRYQDAVVSPWYRNCVQPQCYTVSCMLDTRPSSKFPLKDYKDYNEYFEMKHEVSIFHHHQQLLAVDYLPTRFSLLSPARGKSAGEFVPGQCNDEKTFRKQVLVPELVDVHPISAGFWRAAACLPSICHRLKGLLLADDLMCTIFREAFSVCDADFEYPESWAPLDIDRSGAGTSLRQGSVLLNAHRALEENCDLLVAEDNEFSDLQSKLEAYRRTKKIQQCCMTARRRFDNTVITNATQNLERPVSSRAKTTPALSNSNEDELEDDLLVEVEAFMPMPLPRPRNQRRQTGILAANNDATIEQQSDTAEAVSSVVFDAMSSQMPDADFLARTCIFNYDAAAQTSRTSSLGPEPGLILKALTLLNANDCVNLERLEALGDAFLKFASSCYFFAERTAQNREHNQGVLSVRRSRETCNFNLFRLGKQKSLGSFMFADRFEPMANWLPPGFAVSQSDASAESELEAVSAAEMADDNLTVPANELTNVSVVAEDGFVDITNEALANPTGLLVAAVACNAYTEQVISDKSIADCVEALIAVYLLHGGPSCAVKFMHWIGLKGNSEIAPTVQIVVDKTEEFDLLWQRHNFGALQETLGYKFKNKAYLIEALTHVSYHYNRVTNCYQRLEFLGDAVLDYIVTHILYSDPKCYSPGALSDLRSAVVSNLSYAKLALRFGFHKYLLAVSPALYRAVEVFVKRHQPSAKGQQNTATAAGDEECGLLLEEGECDSDEDVEVPKALSDIFESVAGAIFLDSGCSLETTARVYVRLMLAHFQQYSLNPPRPPVRQLFELQPDARFTRVERNPSDGRVRITLEILGKGTFVSTAGSYKLAKSAVSKQALRFLRQFSS